MISPRFMFAAAVAFLLSMTFPVLSHPSNTLRVTDDPGGEVRDYAFTISWLVERDYSIELGGECKSACTLFTSAPDVCVIEGAELWFHAPFKIDSATGALIYNPATIKLVTDAYPLAIQKWIKANGGLTPRWIILKGQELYDLVPICGEAPTS